MSVLSWLILALGVGGFIGVAQYFNYRQRQQMDPEHELNELERKKEEIKIHSREDRVVKRKLLNFYFLAGVICSVVWWLLLFPEFLRREVDVWLWIILVSAVDVHLVVTSIHNVSQVIGCLALRCKQKVVGGRTKPYFMYVGPHFPLKESYLRHKLNLLKEVPESPPIIGADGVITAGDHYDITWETKDGNPRRSLVPKSDLEVLEELSYVNFKGCLQFIDKIVQRQLGNNFHISHLPADSLRARAETLDYHKQDIDMMTRLWTGIHEYNPELKNALNQAMAQLKFDLDNDPDAQTLQQGLEAQQQTLEAQAQKKLTEELFVWTLTTRFGVEESKAQDLLTNGNGIGLQEVAPLSRIREDGIVFGGLHAEICRVYRYDTPYVIVLTPYPWEEAFSFRDRDWMDVPGFALPMPYTDFDFTLLGTIVIQTAPKKYEPCNIILPVYTDKDLENHKGLLQPHPMDKWTNLQINTLFVEGAADPLARENLRLKGTIQQREQLQESQDKLAMNALKKLWRKLHTTAAMVQAIWPIIVCAVLITAIIAFFVGEWRGAQASKELIEALKNEIINLRGQD